MEKYCRRGRPQMTLWRMRVACWTPKSTNTHSDYVILIAFLLQQLLHERASILRYTYHFVSCYILQGSKLLAVFDNLRVCSSIKGYDSTETGRCLQIFRRRTYAHLEDGGSIFLRRTDNQIPVYTSEDIITSHKICCITQRRPNNIVIYFNLIILWN